MTSQATGCFASNPFEHLPSDILALVYEQLGDVRDLSALGRTSSSNRDLVSAALVVSSYLTAG
jgi:hypothetical protein